MKTITLDLMAGEYIDRACESASRLARQRKCMVAIRFNDVYLLASPKKSPVTMRWQFDMENDRQHRKYLKSKAYVDYQKKRAGELARNQIEVDRLTRLLPQAIANGLTGVVVWLSRFSQIADDVGLKYSDSEIAGTLISAGYVSGENCGLEQAAYKDSVVLGRYIVGQAIDCLNNQLPPHPDMTKKFADEYLTLVQSA